MALPIPEKMAIKGDCAGNWKFFKTQWDNYEIATELHKKDKKIRAATLLTVMGRECLRIYDSLKQNATESQTNQGTGTAAENAATAQAPQPGEDQIQPTVQPGEDPASILKILDGHFLPKKNVIYERYVFNSCMQGKEEPVEDYVARLKEMANNCEYGALTDQLIRDRLVIGTNNRDVRVRLLRESELKLEKAVDICRTYEMTERRLQAINPTETENEAVHYNREKKSWKRKEEEQGTSRRRGEYQEWSDKNCYYCAGKHRKGNCPAYGKTCTICGMKNHIAKACRKGEQENTAEKRGKKKVHQVQEDSEEEETESDESLYMMEQNGKGKEQLLINILVKEANGEKKLCCQVDTGATCNVIAYREVQRITGEKNPDLENSKVKIQLYGGTIMRTVGKIRWLCKFKETMLELCFQVVDLGERTQRPLLSLRSSEQLGLINTQLCNFTSGEKQLTEESIKQDFKDVFQGLGSLPGVYKVEMNEQIRPVQHQPRRFPIAKKERICEKIKDMEREGILEKVTWPTDWISSMTVRESKEKIRIILDPIDLNKAVQRAHYQIPTIDEILPKLAKAKVYSVCDAKDGFLQIVLDEDSRDLTTMWTPLGRFRWNRLPFGVSSGPEEFQRRLHEALEGLKGIEVMADDILVIGSGDTLEEAEAEHDRAMKDLLTRARKVNLKLNAKKLKFKVPEVKFMGHILTRDGLKADPEKTRAVQEMAVPKSAKDLLRFLGFVNYLSRYLPRLADEATHLRMLTRVDVAWQWEDKEELAFERIKRLVTRNPVLRYYDVEKPVTIQCDASEKGLGAAILQEGQPVAFASRTLSTTEQKYAQIEKECLSIVFGCTRFDQYIFGRKEVKIETDHKPLETLFRKPLLKAPLRIQRMKLKLQRYDLAVQYKKGTEMYIADFLSRAQLEENSGEEEVQRNTVYQCQVKSCDFEAELEKLNLAEGLKVSHNSLTQIQENTEKDAKLQKLKVLVLKGWPGTQTEETQEVAEYWPYRDELCVQNGIIYKGTRILIPKVLRPYMLERIHNSHMGIESCLRKARDSLFWPKMSEDIKKTVEMCETCKSMAPTQQQEPLLSHEVPELPWDRIGIDIFTVKGENFLVTVDYFSDFIEVDELQETTTAEIVKCLKRQFSRHGIPSVLVSDNAPNLVSREFELFAKKWEFRHVTSSPMHSRSNGKAEAAVKIAKTLIKKAKKEERDIWLALLDWRNTPTQAMESSPVQRLMSRRTRTLLPITESLLRPKVEEEVQEKIKVRKRKSKANYDQRAKSLPQLEIGEPVYVQQQDGWKQGRAVAEVGRRSYLVEINNKQYRRNRVQIKPFPLRENPQPVEADTEIQEEVVGGTPETSAEKVKGRAAGRKSAEKKPEEGIQSSTVAKQTEGGEVEQSPGLLEMRQEKRQQSGEGDQPVGVKEIQQSQYLATERKQSENQGEGLRRSTRTKKIPDRLKDFQI